MFSEYLLSAKTSNDPISVYTNKNDTDRFSFGFIQDISEEHVLIESVSPLGFYDGYIIKEKEEIYRIDRMDSYGKKMRKLFSLRQQSHQIVERKTDNLILNLMYFANENRLVVTIELFNSGSYDLQGHVGVIQDNVVTIEKLDENGASDGSSVVSLADITIISCDSDNEMALKLLVDNS